MPVITDHQIAILCDIGQGSEIDAAKRQDIDQLATAGFIELTNSGPPAKYRLTGKAHQFIAERGAGLNVA